MEYNQTVTKFNECAQYICGNKDHQLITNAQHTHADLINKLTKLQALKQFADNKPL